MGLLLGIGIVWIAAGVVFLLGFRLLGLRFEVRRGVGDDQLFLPGMAPGKRRLPTPPFRYARHTRPPSLRSRRATSLPTEFI